MKVTWIRPPNAVNLRGLNAYDIRSPCLYKWASNRKSQNRCMQTKKGWRDQAHMLCSVDMPASKCMPASPPTKAMNYDTYYGQLRGSLWASKMILDIKEF